MITMGGTKQTPTFVPQVKLAIMTGKIDLSRTEVTLAIRMESIVGDSVYLRLVMLDNKDQEIAHFPQLPLLVKGDTLRLTGVANVFNVMLT